MTPEHEWENACWHCSHPDSGLPERHDHNGDGKFHWHHYIDPGDGLPSPCGNSDLLERVLAAELEAKSVELREVRQHLENPHRCLSQATRIQQLEQALRFYMDKTHDYRAIDDVLAESKPEVKP